MHLPAEQIEFVVREVMRRLAVAPTAKSTDSSSPGQLQINSRVVTTASFDGRLEAIKRVVVDTNAVVTPAVVDLLKDKAIELVRGKTESIVDRRQVLLVADDNTADTDSIAQQVRTRGFSVRSQIVSNCEQIGEMLEPNEICVVLARKPFEAACHANRDDRACAVFVADSAQCGIAVGEVNANVLVVDRKRIDLNVVSSFLDATGT